jgi:hypothetical protein
MGPPAVPGNTSSQSKDHYGWYSSGRLHTRSRFGLSAQNYGTPGNDNLGGISVDPAGNLLIAGLFYGYTNITFGWGLGVFLGILV